MAWFHKKQELTSVVFFPGTLPLRAENFAYLSELGVQVRNGDAPPGAKWMLELRHHEWGKAKLACLKAGLPPFPPDIVRLSSRLTDQEKQTIRQATNGLWLTMEESSGHVLRDRKNLLRLGNAICGTDGLAVIDTLAMAIWTPPALQDELAHGADLDVEDIYALHCITEGAKGEDEPPTVWAHTHGLQEIGRFDFDLVRPSAEALGSRTDFVRAIAYAVLEERVQLDGEAAPIVRNAPLVKFVSAARFEASASGPGVAEYKDAVDDYHRKKHGVACDDEKRGILVKFLGRGKLRPSTLASGDFPDGMLINYSDAAGDLMAERAQKTLAVFAEWKEEFKEFEPTCIAKLKFRTAGGGHELPWFEVQSVRNAKLDATCLNDPYAIKGLSKGHRAEYGAEQVSDWMIILPFARLSPRAMAMARRIREKREDLRGVMDEMRRAQKN